MRTKWPLVMLGTVVAWQLIAIMVNHGPSGAIIGAAAGSNTLRDPILIVFELAVGFIVQRWWHVLIAAMAIGIGYTVIVARMIDYEPSSITYLGRILSVIVVCSFIALFRNLLIARN